MKTAVFFRYPNPDMETKMGWVDYQPIVGDCVNVLFKDCVQRGVVYRRNWDSNGCLSVDAEPIN